MRAEEIVLVTGARAIAVHTALSALLREHPGLPRLRRGGHLVVRGARQRRSVRMGALDSSGPTALGWGQACGRVEAVVADPILDRLTFVAARLVPESDPHHQLPHDLVARADRVLLVWDGRRPYEECELQLLRAASDRGLPVLLAVTHGDESAQWPEVVLANQLSLARSVPSLAFHSWHPISECRTELRNSLYASCGGVRRA
jgi:hypothetical protein